MRSKFRLVGRVVALAYVVSVGAVLVGWVVTSPDTPEQTAVGVASAILIWPGPLVWAAVASVAYGVLHRRHHRQMARHANAMVPITCSWCWRAAERDMYPTYVLAARDEQRERLLDEEFETKH